MQLTPEQTAVVAAPGGNLLVSAAAGSGKTAVLTDRIVRRIIDGELNVQQVLVMTFTEAAARSMKDKIEQKLRAALADAEKSDARQRIARQISLLPSAAISTIHAFCLDIIRNFYHCARDEEGRARIEPGFRVDDGLESDLLLRKTLDEWMNEQYESIDNDDIDLERQNAFYRLIEGYGSNSGDRPVRELMQSLFHFMRSLPDYQEQVEKWLTGLERTAEQFSDSPYLESLVRQLILLLDKAGTHLDEMESILQNGIRFIGQPERNHGMNRQFFEVIATLRRLEDYLKKDGRDWDAIRSMGAGLAGLDLPRGSAGDSPEKKAFMDLFVRHVSEIIHCLTGDCATAKYSAHFIFKTRHLFCLSSAEIEADITAMLPSVRLLFELVLGMDKRYSQSKQAAGVIDFSDFEHFALTILREEEARKYYRNRFKEVYVDEYQDTSSIQEAIIGAVSDDNCLMVGDIKQSIYRFRHARPRIFIDRTAACRDKSGGSLHELNKNFRSVAGILNATNDLFSQIMSRGAGEIDYDQRQALVAFRDNSSDNPEPVTLLILNRMNPEKLPTDAEETEDIPDLPADEAVHGLSNEEFSRYEQEALVVADRMISLHTAGTAWRDMVVLSRTRFIGQACRDQLEAQAIPVLSDMDGSFLESPVLRQMEALLRLLDNLRQDVPMAAVLRSAIWQGGFQDEDLLLIRLFDQDHYPGRRFFHQAALAYALEGPDSHLKKQLSDCLAWLDRLRRREQLISLSELIGLVFDESGWLERLAARPDGQGLEDIRSLRQFRQWAELFEARRPRGLHAFVSHIDNLRQRGPIENPFPAADSREDAVRIMTIHGSKGLEFPIIFVVGTGYDLTPKDSSDSLLISENLGVGMDFADPERQIRYPTHLKLAMHEELKAAGLAEELRLLYVAMTRAMDQLFIVGSVKIDADKAEKRLSSLVMQAKACRDLQLPDYLVLAGRCYLDWIFMALSRQSELDLDWLSGGVYPEVDFSLPDWRIEFIQMGSLMQKRSDQSTLFKTAQPVVDPCDPVTMIRAIFNLSADEIENHAELSEKITRRIVSSYRYETASRLPAKLTVSELKRREQHVDPDDLPRGISLVFDEWPETSEKTLCGDDAPSALELGLLLHDFLRYMDLSAAREQPNAAEISRQLDAMQKIGIFQGSECRALSGFAEKLLDFATSDLVNDMIEAGRRPGCPIYKEMPFTLAVAACDVHSGCPGLAADDKVLIQGIIDCWYEAEDGITLVDYKSDRLPMDEGACRIELEKRYGLQMNYYAQAIESVAGRPVTRRLIWVIRQGRTVELPVFADRVNPAPYPAGDVL